MNTSIDMTAVTELYNHFHTKVQERPSLYLGTGFVHIPMPIELKEFCNRAAGNNGYDETIGEKIPNGIRVTTHDPVEVRSRIFQSPQSLAQFIADEYDYGALVKRKSRKGRTVTVSRNKSDSSVRIDNTPANKVWPTLYYKYDVPTLTSKFGKATVIEARKYLTVTEMELRFGIEG